MPVYFHNYVLIYSTSGGASLIILFLNKLNNAALNPVIFIIIILGVAVTSCYKSTLLNYKLLGSVMLFLLPWCAITCVESFFDWDPVYVQIAPTLTNGLLIIHPVLLYAFYSAVLYSYVYYSSATKVRLLNWGLLYPYTLHNLKIPAYLIGTVALGLGSW